MLAYAAGRPVVGNRRASPNSLLFIASAHVIALAFLMSAKMELPKGIVEPPIKVEFYPVPVDPPKPAERIEANQLAPRTPTADDPKPRIELPSQPRQVLSREPGAALGPIGPAIDPFPRVTPGPAPAKSGPVLLSSQAELKPPYPRAKLLSEEEASLTLRLSIDDRGRVVAVDPVGRADRIFLDAARKKQLAPWRYQPAMADGRAVASTLVTTLHFRIDG